MWAVLFSASSPGLRRLRRDADLLPQAHDVQSPTLVVWGEHDVLLSPLSFSRLAERLPHGTKHALADAGHTPPMEAPEEFVQALIGFLKS